MMGHRRSAASRNVMPPANYNYQRIGGNNPLPCPQCLVLYEFTTLADSVEGALRSYQKIKAGNEYDLQSAVALEGPISMAADVQHNTFRVSRCSEHGAGLAVSRVS